MNVIDSSTILGLIIWLCTILIHQHLRTEFFENAIEASVIIRDGEGVFNCYFTDLTSLMSGLVVR